MVTTTGVISVVVRVLKEVGRGRTQRAKSLRALADRKFKELEATHDLFVELLGRISDAAAQSIKKADNVKNVAAAEKILIGAVLDVEKRRFQRVDARRKNVAEARVYSEKELNETGVFKTIPPDVAEHLQRMMAAYTAYFLVSNDYSHELGLALFQIRSSVIVLKMQNERFSSSKRDLRSRATQVQAITRDAIQKSRVRWTDVATVYHEFNFCLREHGYV